MTKVFFIFASFHENHQLSAKMLLTYGISGFASFLENHQLSAEMLLSVCLLIWGFLPPFLGIFWQSQLFIIFRSIFGKDVSYFSSVFEDSFRKNAVKYRYIVLSTCWSNIVETFCVVFLFPLSFILRLFLRFLKKLNSFLKFN
jgi:hypothetical protein